MRTPAWAARSAINSCRAVRRMPNPTPCGKGASHRQIPVTKSGCRERPRAGLVERDAKRARGGNAIRHDALAAGLVDGRLRTIGHGDVEAAVARGDGRGQAGRAAADDEDIGGLS